VPDRDPALTALVDRAEIVDCLHRYTRGMDRLDRDLARSAYHEGATDDHAGLVADVDAFLDWAFEYHSHQVRHQHYLGNVTIDLGGARPNGEGDVAEGAEGAEGADVAHVESYYTFIGSYPDESRPIDVVGGRYLDRFERRDGRWAIAVRICTTEWRTRLTSGLSARAAEVLAFGVAEDTTDLSYLRPLEVTRPHQGSPASSVGDRAAQGRARH
jgi:hypothetical protein